MICFVYNQDYFRVKLSHSYLWSYFQNKCKLISFSYIPNSLSAFYKGRRKLDFKGKVTEISKNEEFSIKEDVSNKEEVSIKGEISNKEEISKKEEISNKGEISNVKEMINMEEISGWNVWYSGEL